MIHPPERERRMQARMHSRGKELIEVEDKITGSLGKSHEKIKSCETKMETQRHGRWQAKHIVTDFREQSNNQNQGSQHPAWPVSQFRTDMWQTIIFHCWKSRLLLLFTRCSTTATVFESASIWPGSLAPLKSRQRAARTPRAWQRGQGGRGYALHGLVVNQAPEGEGVHPAARELRVTASHASWKGWEWIIEAQRYDGVFDFYSRAEM